MFAPLRRRLVLVNAAIIAAIVVVLAAAILLLIDRVLIDQQRTELGETTAALVARLQDAEDADGPRLPPAAEEGTFYVLWAANGKTSANPSGVDVAPLGAAARAALGGTSDTSIVHVGSLEALVSSTPIERDGTRVGALQVGRDLAPVRDVEGRLIAIVLGAGALGLALSLLGGWLLAERSLVPIRRAFRRQQEFAADASHEMRTPLAVVDAGLQVLRRHPERTVAEHAEVLDSMDAQVGRMETLVAALLTLARADAGAIELERHATDVDELVRSVVGSLQGLAGSKGGRLEAAQLAGGIAPVDPERLRQLLTILVENGLAHGGHGVRVEVSAAREHGWLVIEVADDGPGIPPAERERVFERFYRGEAARSTPGTGLGLAIAEWVALAHGGRIELLDRAPGAKGLRARVSLPLRSEAAVVDS